MQSVNIYSEQNIDMKKYWHEEILTWRNIDIKTFDWLLNIPQLHETLDALSSSVAFRESSSCQTASGASICPVPVTKTLEFRITFKLIHYMIILKVMIIKEIYSTEKSTWPSHRDEIWDGIHSSQTLLLSL